MKILFTNANIIKYAQRNKPVVGGSERQQWLIAQALAKRNHESIIYTFSDNGNQKDAFEINGVLFRFTDIKSPIFRWIRMLALEKPDWWYWRGATYYLPVIVLISHLFNVRVVFASSLDWDCIPKNALYRKAFLWPLYGFGLYLVDKIIVQHENQYETLPSRLKKKAKVIKSIQGKLPAAAEERKTHTQPKVTWIGALRETKRPHLLPTIAQDFPEVNFFVYGRTAGHRTRPEYTEIILHLLKTCKNIKIAGLVPPEQIPAILMDSDVLISTALVEGFPNVFLQAWACKTPVLSLEVDPRNVINTYNLGFVALNTKQMKSFLKLLLEDKQLRLFMGNNGVRYIEQYHNENEIIQTLIEYLECDGSQ